MCYSFQRPHHIASYPSQTLLPLSIRIHFLFPRPLIRAYQRYIFIFLYVQLPIRMFKFAVFFVGESRPDAIILRRYFNFLFYANLFFLYPIRYFFLFMFKLICFTKYCVFIKFLCFEL